MYNVELWTKVKRVKRNYTYYYLGKYFQTWLLKSVYYGLEAFHNFPKKLQQNACNVWRICKRMLALYTPRL